MKTPMTALALPAASPLGFRREVGRRTRKLNQDCMPSPSWRTILPQRTTTTLPDHVSPPCVARTM